MKPYNSQPYFVWQSLSEKAKVVCKNLTLNFLRVRGKANKYGDMANGQLQVYNLNVASVENKMREVFTFLKSLGYVEKLLHRTTKRALEF